MNKINLENAKKTVKQFVDTEKNLSESLKTYLSILGTLKTNGHITQDQFNILSEGLNNIIKNSDSLLSSLAPLDKEDLPDNFINLLAEKMDNSMQKRITFPMISYWARYENTILPLIQSLEENDETKKIIYEELTKRKLGVKGLNHFASMPWQRLTRSKDLIERIASESGSDDLKQKTGFQKLLVRFGNTEIALEELAPSSKEDKSVDAPPSQVEDIESGWVDLVESNRKNASVNLTDALKPIRSVYHPSGDDEPEEPPPLTPREDEASTASKASLPEEPLKETEQPKEPAGIVGEPQKNADNVNIADEKSQISKEERETRADEGIFQTDKSAEAPPAQTNAETSQKDKQSDLNKQIESNRSKLLLNLADNLKSRRKYIEDSGDVRSDEEDDKLDWWDDETL